MSEIETVQASEPAADIVVDEARLSEILGGAGAVGTEEGGVETTMNLEDIFVRRSNNVRVEDGAGYSAEKIDNMKQSIIAAGGILQSLHVFPCPAGPKTNGKDYALMIGFCRATALAQLDAEGKINPNTGKPYGQGLPVRITQPKGRSELRLLQLIENHQRSGLNPVETALAIKHTLDNSKKEAEADPSKKPLTSAEVAAIIGLKPAQVSQYVGLLDMHSDVQKMVQDGELTFSHAREMQSSKYEIDKDTQPAVGKIGQKKTYGDFCKYLASHYAADGSGDGEESDEPSTKGKSQQRRTSLLTPKVLSESYKPYLAKELEKAKAADDAGEKKFTLSQLLEARLDTIKSIEKDENAKLSQAIAPFIKAQEEAEAAEKAKADANKHRDQWFKKQVRRVNELMGLPVNVETGERPYPSLNSAIAAVATEVEESVKGDKAAAYDKEAGFAASKIEDFATKLNEAWSEDTQAKAKAKADREAKAAEKAAKEAAEGGSDDSDGEEG